MNKILFTGGGTSGHITPNILIPLSKKASRGDQLLNAQSFEKLEYTKE